MRRELRTLLALFASRWPRYSLGIGALVITDLGNLTIPWFVGRFIDEARAGQAGFAMGLRYAGTILAVAIGVAIFRYVWRIFIFGTARQLDYSYRKNLFAHLLTLDAGFYQRRRVGDLMAHATNDLAAVRMALGEGVMAGFDSLITGGLALIAMAGIIDARLTLAALLPLPLLAIFEVWYGAHLHARYKDVQAGVSGLSEQVQEQVTGIRVIKAFAREGAARARFAATSQDYRDRVLRMVRLSGLNEPVIAGLSGLSMLISLGYGGYLVLSGELSLGRFVAFNSYLGMLVWPMLALGWVANLLHRGTASLGRLQELLDEVPVVRDAPDAVAPAGIRGELEIRDLSFRHAPELAPVIQDLSCHVAPGQTLGILGRMGSGKTTLANLLMRVHEPPPGTIWLDGHDVRQLSLASLRGAIGYVPQDGFLFSDTVRANLAFAPGHVEDERLLEIAELVQLRAEIEALPSGFDTMLGERGITLSGGQRQRLGLGRALLKDPPVLILDDCLSAVDTLTEARILARLRPWLRQRTTVLVAHRVSALQHADWILVLDGGCIVEQGTHAELVAGGGLYRRIHDRQALEAAIAEEA